MSNYALDATQEDYYALLKIPPNATRKQIADAYKKIAVECHPDRLKDPAQTSEATLYFTKCTQAYDALCDPVTRALYDLVTGVTEDSPEERKRINNMKKEDAKRAVALMEESVHGIIREERQRGGLVILDARYGRLDFDPNRPLSPPKSRPGQYIDVTIPLQCMVDGSQLIMSGNGSKSWQEGFYDPSEDCEPSKNTLWIQYLFLNQLHHVVVADEEELRMPMSNHLITAQQAEMERELELLEQEEKEKKKRRRRFLVVSLLLGIGGTLLYRNRNSPRVGGLMSRVMALVPGGSSSAPRSASSSDAQAASDQGVQ